MSHGRRDVLNLTLSFVLTGVCSIEKVVHGSSSLYIASDMYPRGLYADPQWLWANVILVMMWSSRVWLLSHRGELNDDPISFALRDPPSVLMGIAMAVVLLLAAL